MFGTFSLDFLHIFYYLLLVLALSFALVIISILLVSRNYDIEKNSAYECGFHPFEDTRSKFDVRFYLVAILFIVFDLEVAFLFPWVLTFSRFTSLFEFYTVILFLGVLLVGFYYEWQKGALDWE
jgi:NADH-quinone oxidoreductase subunit A